MKKSTQIKHGQVQDISYTIFFSLVTPSLTLPNDLMNCMTRTLKVMNKKIVRENFPSLTILMMMKKQRKNKRSLVNALRRFQPINAAHFKISFFKSSDKKNTIVVTALSDRLGYTEL